MREERYLEKAERCDRVNELLRVIGSVGRRFFYTPISPHKTHGHFSAMDVSPKTGHIFFLDSYSGKRIYTHYEGAWRGFTNGGTLHRLIEALRDHIQHGRPCPNHFGPWPQWVCEGDLWGYGEDMRLVRESAIALGILKTAIPDSHPSQKPPS